jgi:hypothetical protein
MMQLLYQEYKKREGRKENNMCGEIAIRCTFAHFIRMKSIDSSMATLPKGVRASSLIVAGAIPLGILPRNSYF